MARRQNSGTARAAAPAGRSSVRSSARASLRYCVTGSRMARHATCEPSLRTTSMTCAGICRRAHRFRKPLVVRKDDHLTLLRHRGEHASQTVNLARVHRLDRIVDHHESEGRLRQQHPRQKKTECKRVDLPLAHHAERLAIGSVDADVQNEVTPRGRAFERQAVEGNAAVLPERRPNLRGPLRDGTKPLGPDPVRLPNRATSPRSTGGGPLRRHEPLRAPPEATGAAWRPTGARLPPGVPVRRRPVREVYPRRRQDCGARPPGDRSAVRPVRRGVLAQRSQARSSASTSTPGGAARRRLFGGADNRASAARRASASACPARCAASASVRRRCTSASVRDRHAEVSSPEPHTGHGRSP